MHSCHVSKTRKEVELICINAQLNPFEAAATVFIPTAVSLLVHNILSSMRHDRKSLFFQWDLDASCRNRSRHWNRTRFYSCVATRPSPLKK